MEFKVAGAFVVGIVLCMGVMSGGFASAKSQQAKGHKQVNVKLEWITVRASDLKSEEAISGKKSVDSLVLVADAGEQASSKNSTEHNGVQTKQEASVVATLNGDGTATLNLDCEVTKAGSEMSSAACRTTVTMALEETKVVRSFVRKGGSDESETLLFVTTSAH